MSQLLIIHYSKLHHRDIRFVDPSTEEAGDVEWRFDEAGDSENMIKGVMRVL